METFSALLALCAGNSPVAGEFPSKRPVTRSCGVFFDLRVNKGWVNNRGAGDLRRYRTHYDLIVKLGKTFHITLWGESIGPDVFILQSASNAESWYCRKLERTVDQIQVLSWLEFSNIIFDWLVVVTPANPEPDLKFLVN